MSNQTVGGYTAFRKIDAKEETLFLSASSMTNNEFEIEIMM